MVRTDRRKQKGLGFNFKKLHPSPVMVSQISKAGCNKVRNYWEPKGVKSIEIRDLEWEPEGEIKGYNI